MGGGGSFFLPTGQPGDERIAHIFREFEQECISRNLKANEIYDLLSSKYDVIISGEKGAGRAAASPKKAKRRLRRKSIQHKPTPTAKSSLHCNGVSSEPSSLHVTPAAPSGVDAAMDKPPVSNQFSRDLKIDTTASRPPHRRGSVDSTHSSPSRRGKSPTKSGRGAGAADVVRGRRSTVVRHTASTLCKAIELAQAPSKKPPIPSRFSVISAKALAASRSQQALASDAARSDAAALAHAASQPCFPSKEDDLALATQRNSLSSEDSCTAVEGFSLDLLQQGSLAESDEELDPARDDSASDDDDDEVADVLAELPPLVVQPTFVQNPSGRRSSVFDDAVLPPQLFECRLCQRKFGSAELLETHLLYSQLHQQSVQRRAATYQQALQETDQLGALLRKAAQHFQRAYETKKSFLEGRISAEQMHWQRAIGKVLLQFTASQVDKIMDDLRVAEALRATATAAAAAAVESPAQPAAPSTVELLLTTSRFFWRTKTRFNLHVLLHRSASRSADDDGAWLEVVCVLLPELITLAQDPSALASSPATAGQQAEPTEHIFLDVRRLAAIPALAEATSAAQRVASWDREALVACAKFAAQQVHIDFDAVRNHGKHPTRALYFDDHGYERLALPSPVIFGPADAGGALHAPTALSDLPTQQHVPCGNHCVQQDYEAIQREMQQKIDAVVAAQSDLHDAVARAATYAAKVRLRTPPATFGALTRGFSFNNGAVSGAAGSASNSRPQSKPGSGQQSRAQPLAKAAGGGEFGSTTTHVHHLQQRQRSLLAVPASSSPTHA
jgi:hypothetical protein